MTSDRGEEPPAAGPPVRAAARHPVLRALAWPLRYLLALVIVFEEWGWAPLQRAMQRIARLPVLRRLEALVIRLPPYAALVVFVLPGALLLPVKLGALWLIGHGQRAAGVALIVLAKIAGTAIAARLFELTRPTLMQLPWFAAALGRWVAWKDGLLEWVRASVAWRVGRVIKRRLRRWLRIG